MKAIVLRRNAVPSETFDVTIGGVPRCFFRFVP